MDQLKLTISHTEEHGEAVEITINGRSLIEMLREIELPFAQKEGHPDIAGEYIGLHPEYIFFPSRHFFGEPANEFFDYEGKVSILECRGCGVPGCWPFLVKITVEEDKVIWSDIEQPHRSEESSTIWNYDQLRPLVFDRKQYEAEWSKYQMPTK